MCHHGLFLCAGVALAVKTMRPEVLVIGVEPENCQSFSNAMKVSKPIKSQPFTIFFPATPNN
jgi:threonine dehydratase